MNQTNQANPTKWHQIFGAVQQEHLGPVGIKVIPEFQIGSSPPRADMLLLQQAQVTNWTGAQRARLPDGIRDSFAGRILLELKYSESITQETFEQLIGYLFSYRQVENLKREQVQGFVVSSMTPKSETLTRFGYHSTSQAGVYHSEHVMLAEITLLLLNELSDEPHNLFFKLFASRKQEKLKAAAGVQDWWLPNLSSRFSWLLDGLFKLWFSKGVPLMEAITTEILIEQGKALQQVIRSLTAEQIALLPDGQRLLKKGFAEGRREGRREGESIGWQKGQRLGQQLGQLEGEGIGWQKGRAETRQLAMKNIRQTLTMRFNIPLEQYDKQLQPLDLAAMEKLNELAFTVTTLAEFEQILAQQTMLAIKTESNTTLLGQDNRSATALDVALLRKS